MRRICATTVICLGIATSGSAQLLQVNSYFNQANVNDFGETFGTGFNDATVYENQHVVANSALGSEAFASSLPWNVTLPSGVMSGNGEAALVQDNLTNGATSATYTDFLSVNTQLFTTYSGPGPYFGVEGQAYSGATSSFTFTPTQTSIMSLSGTFTGLGLQLGLQASLNNLTTHQTTSYVNISQGGGSVSFNDVETLIAGDEYSITTNVIGDPFFEYAPNTNINFADVEGGTGYLAATFTATPEPVSFGLLGLGALALLRRRRKSA